MMRAWARFLPLVAVACLSCTGGASDVGHPAPPSDGGDEGGVPGLPGEAAHALETGDFARALALCGGDAAPPSCEQRWCDVLARTGLAMAEMNDYLVPTFRSGDITATVGGADRGRLTQLYVDMRELSSRVTPLVEEGCRITLPKYPFRFGDAEDPVVLGEVRGTWTPRSALFLGAAIDSVQLVFAEVAGLVPAPPVSDGGVPELPPLLESIRSRLHAFDGLLFDNPTTKAALEGGWVDDGDGKPGQGDELLVDLFESGSDRRVFDFSGAEVVRSESLPLGKLTETAALPVPHCGYQRFHVDTLLDANVGTTDGLAFSHDGQSIAFPMRVSGKYQIHVAAADGTNARCLTCDHAPAGGNDGVRWNPVTDAMVFVSTRDHPYAIGGAGGGFGQELYAMRPDGTAPTRLTTSHAWATNYHANFSHDGKQLVWGTTEARSWDVMVADFVDDAAGFRLENVRRLVHDTTWWETHDFTNDGRFVITTNTRAGWQSSDIYAIDVQTGERRRLTDHPAWDEHAHLSPDGTRMSWISARFTPASLVRMTDGSLSAAYDFFWIVPGIFFAFLSPPVSFTTELTLMTTDGTGVMPLTRDGEVVADNVWSPDGGRILFRQTPTATRAPAKIRMLTFDDCR